MKRLNFGAALHGVSGLIFLVACGVSSANAATDAPQGCGALAGVVEQSLLRVIRQHAMRPAVRLTPDQFVDLSCAKTAASVTRAFSAAFRAQGMDIVWSSRGTIDPGDYCQSHFLDQCYPRSRNGTQTFATTNLADIGLAWDTVRAGIKQVMPFGSAGDMAYFRAGRLAEVLTLSLDVTMRMQRDATQGVFQTSSLLY